MVFSPGVSAPSYAALVVYGIYGVNGIKTRLILRPFQQLLLSEASLKRSHSVETAQQQRFLVAPQRFLLAPQRFLLAQQRFLDLWSPTTLKDLQVTWGPLSSAFASAVSSVVNSGMSSLFWLTPHVLLRLLSNAAENSRPVKARTLWTGSARPRASAGPAGGAGAAPVCESDPGSVGSFSKVN